MKKICSLRRLTVILVSLFLFATPGSATKSTASTADGITLITAHLIGQPVAVRQTLYWLDIRSGDVSIYSYNVTGGHESLIKQSAMKYVPGDGYTIASDGTTVVWSERLAQGGSRLAAYNLKLNQESTVASFSGTGELGALALDNGILYYQYASNQQRGIYERNLFSGKEQLISPTGQNPVAANSRLLWSEESYAGKGEPARWTLHLRGVKSEAPDKVIAKAEGAFSGYVLSGDNVVFAPYPSAPDPRAYIYDIKAGIAKPLSGGPATYPAAGSGQVAWTNESSELVYSQPSWSINRYSVADSAMTVAVAQGPDLIRPTALFEQGNLALVRGRELYLTASTPAVVSLPAAGSQMNMQPDNSCTVNPVACGHVYIGLHPQVNGSHNDKGLFDSGGYWPLKGVQFLIPSADTLDGAMMVHSNFITNEWEQQSWMDTVSRNNSSSQSLNVRTLRLFVNIPDSNGTSSTTYEDIYKDVRRANARGMRTGLVFFDYYPRGSMTSAQANWFIGLAQYLRGLTNPNSNLDWTYAIAYVSAENEINNHCPANGGYDCMDLGVSGHEDYRNGAAAWVRVFTQIWRDHAPGVLTTVGLATEMANYDSFPATNGYFRYPTNGLPRLVDMVDFLSPHNYHSGAFAVWDAIRGPLSAGRDSNVAITLEEFGYQTDPVNRNSTWREGTYANAQNENPWASYQVWANLLALAQRNYSSGAAWMMADMNTRNCNGAPDYFTGLYFNASGPYCGGTTSRADRTLKATGQLVRDHMRNYYP